MIETDYQMEKLHNLEFKIALEVKRICEKNNIKYFLIAGTLLGAVRHGGFIPWDDDMDIGMLREDYDLFLKACKNHLSDIFYLQSWDSDPDYPFSFSKIRLKGTQIVEKFSENSNMQNGIFIDIFPFDNVPDSKIKAFIQGKKYFLCKRILWIKKGYGNNIKNECFKQKIRYYVFKLFSMCFSYDFIKNYFYQTQIKYNFQQTKKVVADGSYSYSKESINREWVCNLEYAKFKSEEFLCFKDRKDYLEHFYGNYMKLPPEDKRNRHLLVKVDFGKY